MKIKSIRIKNVEGDASLLASEYMPALTSIAESVLTKIMDEVEKETQPWT